MTTSSYAEIAVTTNFSFLRGASHPRELVLAAALHGYAAIDEYLTQLPDFVLRLSHGHAVSRHDDHLLPKGHHYADIRGLDGLHAAGDRSGGGAAGVTEA